MFWSGEGIGYEISVPMNEQMDRLYEGQELKIYTYLYVREDALALYGFLEKDDLEMFRLLLGVNGVGPKAALGILTAVTADELRFAVLSEDVKTISRAPGIGKKTAQKLILDLKDKVKLQDAFERKLEHGAAQADTAFADARKEAAEALTAWAMAARRRFGRSGRVDGWEQMDVETLLKAALKNM